MPKLVKEEFREHITQLLSELPDSPGVYIHKDKNGNIIYIGKAISLKNRVRSYFQSPKNQPPKVIAMVCNIADFEYILCASETEALTLESNLIKAHRPHYNILLKDDKHFPYAKINLNTPFPRIEIVHRIDKQDKSKYLGPYLSKYALRSAIEGVREIFPLRSCKRDIVKAIEKKERACLYYQIKKCCAPCIGNISEDDYNVLVNNTLDFLNGKTEDVIATFTAQMNEHAENMEFEKAAVLRDRIANINILSKKQIASATNTQERDVISLSQNDNDTVMYMLFVRNGKVIGNDHISLISNGDAQNEIISSFLAQYYSQDTYIPKEIIIDTEIEDKEVIEKWLSELKGQKVSLIIPQKGVKKQLLDMAKRNGEEFLNKALSAKQRMWERTEGAIKDLKEKLNLKDVPQRIEAYDISHTSGMDPVASMIVFEKGKPSPKQYRRFKIKLSQNNDYAAMQEVLTRRFNRAKTEIEQGKTQGFAQLPDLIIIDGGKGQLSSAMKIVDEYQYDDIEVISLAERLEEVFLPNKSDPIMIESGTPALHLMQRVRDEAHRFAITFHRSLRQKSFLFSELEEIPGIGEKRKKLLFEKFISLDAISKATFEELTAIKGIDKKSAQAIVDHFLVR